MVNGKGWATRRCSPPLVVLGWEQHIYNNPIVIKGKGKSDSAVGVVFRSDAKVKLR